MIVVGSRHEEGNPSIFHRSTLASEPGLLQALQVFDTADQALQVFDTADQDFLLEPTSLAHTHPLTTPYEDCFRWDAVVHKLLDATDNPLYCVIFRSVRNADADTQELYLADAEAHEVARKGGGLLKYWYGTLNSRRECLATCIWSSRESARAALGRPAHAHAMKLASKMYQTYTLERCWLRRGRGGPDGRKIVFEML